MGKFYKNHVDLRYFSHRNMALLDSFTYKCDNGDVVSCPRNLKTDLASIPMGFARMVVPKLGKHTKAAIVHDGLYRDVAAVYDCMGATVVYTRKQADKVFREAMKAEGETRSQRWLIYHAVRLGGGKAWREGHKKVDTSWFGNGPLKPA